MGGTPAERCERPVKPHAQTARRTTAAQVAHSPYSGISDCMAKVLRHEGVGAFYKSYRTTVRAGHCVPCAAVVHLLLNAPPDSGSLATGTRTRRAAQTKNRHAQTQPTQPTLSTQPALMNAPPAVRQPARSW